MSDILNGGAFPDPAGEVYEYNEYTSAAVEATVGSDNLIDALSFSGAKILAGKDPDSCYSQAFISVAAAAPAQSSRDWAQRLKKHFGKEFNTNRWNADVRDARATMVAKDLNGQAFIRSENGSIKPILANAIIQLRESKLRIAFDCFSDRIVIEDESPWGTTGTWRDIDDSQATNYLQHRGVHVATAVTSEAARVVAHEKRFHPVRDWLVNLRWDGVPRLDTWMIDYLGAEDTDLTRNVSAAWPMSAYKRIIHPGEKCDYVIVLEGPQRQGKSSALRALTNGHLAGDGGIQWFRDSLPDIDKDDIGAYMQGVWIIEIAELDAIRGKQWTRVKSFISTQRDTYRRKYGRNMEDYPRQCVFAASTNEDHWGGDRTGLTRFWPVKVRFVDTDGIIKNREQLWAEAAFRCDEGAIHWLTKEMEEAAREVQAERQPDDPITERVHKVIREREDVSIAEIITALGCGDREAYRIAGALNSLGWKRYRSRLGGTRTYRYILV